MGDAPQAQADVMNSAQEARNYVERLVNRLVNAGCVKESLYTGAAAEKEVEA